MLFVADADSLGARRALVDEAEGLPERSPGDAVAMVPILRRKRIAAVPSDADAREIDLAALHEGWLKAAKAAGAGLRTRSGVLSGDYEDGQWIFEIPGHSVAAPVVVNAAECCYAKPDGKKTVRVASRGGPGRTARRLSRRHGAGRDCIASNRR